jgi:hypothetical protein
LQFVAAILICFEFIQVALWSHSVTSFRALAVGASSVSLVASICVLTLIYLNHRSSLQPSFFLGGYLFFSILLSIPEARSLFLRNDVQFSPLAVLFSGSMVAKTCLLAFEEVPRGSAATALGKISLESIGGALNRSLLWWLNGLLVVAYRQLIDIADLGPIQYNFDSATLLSRISDKWIKSIKFEICSMRLVAKVLLNRQSSLEASPVLGYFSGDARRNYGSHSAQTRTHRVQICSAFPRQPYNRVCGFYNPLKL